MPKEKYLVVKKENYQVVTVGENSRGQLSLLSSDIFSEREQPYKYAFFNK